MPPTVVIAPDAARGVAGFFFPRFAVVRRFFAVARFVGRRFFAVFFLPRPAVARRFFAVFFFPRAAVRRAFLADFARAFVAFLVRVRRFAMARG